MLRLVRLTLHRARQERLPQLAGSLTFATLMAVVPLLAVSFALFAHVPWARRLGQAMESHLLRSLLPADLGKALVGHLGRFAANAQGLTLLGSLALLATALALLLSVERALNRLWQVKQERALPRRLGVVLLMGALGPPMLGASLWATSALLGLAAGAGVPRAARLALDLGPVVLGTLALACLFGAVPNAKVARHHALAGGLAGSLALELGKRGFAAWLLKLPTYQAVYGAYAVLPAFLLWVYFSWLVTLGAALVTASLGGAGSRREGRARGR